MSVPHAIEARARAAQEAHTTAWQRQRQAEREGDWLGAGLWASIAGAALEEIEECAYGLRAVHDDGILRGNADLVPAQHQSLGAAA